MDWFTDRHFFLLAVMVYGISMIYSVFLWRKGFRQDNRVTYFLLLFAFGLHTIAMVSRGFSFNHCPVNNLYEATTFVIWTIVATYLVIGISARLRFLGAFASPLLFAIGVFALMPSLDQAHGPKPEFTGGGVSLHAALILLAYGAFGLAAVAGIMFLTHEHNLKFNKLRAMLSLLPSIQRLDTAGNRLVLSGFALLTVGLAAGAHLPRPEGVHYFEDPKVIWSALLWMLYLSLLLARRLFAQRGRKFAIGTIGAFAFLVLTFWGTNLLSGLHNPAEQPEASSNSTLSRTPERRSVERGASRPSARSPGLSRHDAQTSSRSGCCKFIHLAIDTPAEAGIPNLG